MSSEVRHLVDRGQTYPLVQLSGVLNTGSAPTIRSVLLDLIAEQPEAVVVDVGGLSLDGPESAGVLRDIRRETTDWPAAHLALCATDAGAWQGTGWPVWPDPAQAFAALGEPEPEHRVSLELEPSVGAARQSRELITESCGRWDCPELAGPACIVVTELVNNVVAHAHTPMIVLLATHGEGMSVAVRDRSATVPSFDGTPVPVTAYGGRGMLLIDSVATRWGSLVLDGGKVVWALLSDEEAAKATPRKPDGASMADPARG
ncbi:ATP-binding protein [Actinoplanes sp. NPDC048988]|uniref:ATP-binding protein n=1 Tax=Actinoplanes sp. NPDC048988 TaxID=3363901 RepID=UPI0037146675